MTMCIDIPELRLLLNDVAAEIKTIKTLLRSPWGDRPMAAEQKNLAALKRKATNLCILRALCRGKYHLAKPPRDLAAAWSQDCPQHKYHQDVADRAADRYRLHRTEDKTCHINS